MLTEQQRERIQYLQTRCQVGFRNLSDAHDTAAELYGLIGAALDTIWEQEGLLRLVWNHMHGVDLNGLRRRLGDDSACAANWIKLMDMLDAKYGAKS